jgi:HD-like signal output (HDOD) protein
MLKKTMIILALLSFGCVGSQALAQHGHHGHAPHHETSHTLHDNHALHGAFDGVHLPSDEMLKQWGFDDELIKTLRELKLKYETKSIDLEADLKKAKLELKQAHEDSQVNKSTMLGAIDGFYKAQAALMKLQVTAAFEARDIMGEELFEKIREAHRS